MAAPLAKAPDHSKLPPDELRWTCDASALPFTTTAELAPHRGIIGQSRALEAITLGLEMDAPGYNVFLTGFVGTGRNTTIRSVLERLDRSAKPPPDLCYVHNFVHPDRPRALFLPAGRGRMLVAQMREMVRYLERDLPRLFQDEPYRKRRERIEERFRFQQRERILALEKKVEAEGFALVQVQVGAMSTPQVVPVVDGEPRFIADLEEAVQEDKFDAKRLEEIRNRQRQYVAELQEVVREAMKIESDLRARLSEHDVESARPLVNTCLALVREQLKDVADVQEWLAQAEAHALSHLKDFVHDESEPSDGTTPLNAYVVNLLVDNADTKGAPVIVENMPTLQQLFGMIERSWSRNGESPVDHTRLKAGSLHRANGGYLVLNGSDLFSEPVFVWHAVKRTLRTGYLEFPSSESLWILGPPALKPEGVGIRVKVLLVGDVDLYSLLHAYDDDFAKIFKVRADFDTEMANAGPNHLLYGAFVQRLVEEEKALPFDRTGVARIIEHGARLAGRRTKLSTRFNMIADLIREGSYLAKKEGTAAVSGDQVVRALELRDYRNGLTAERLQELIAEGTVFIEVEGWQTGQLNGLAVFESGEHVFGLPSKITASVALGNAGIINIEREAELSGRTHDKGVQILAGYLRAKYAQERPLTLSASICFEQSYAGVDGDSASSTEVYAILSALADVPMRQDLAITGSVNQKGEIQPIGGVNEKVEGFFDICRLKKLSGTQGVLIPRANVADLMLAPRVVEAVREGRFHVIPVETIDQGIEILSGVAAGQRIGKNRYPVGTVNGRVEARLRKMAGLMRDYGGPHS